MPCSVPSKTVWPFAGVPFLVKDLFQEYAGYPTSYGCQGLKRIGYIAETNAEIVNRWEQAGIVTFGRTNTLNSELKALQSQMPGEAVKPVEFKT